MQEIESSQNPKFPLDLKQSGPQVMQDKGNIYRHEMNNNPAGPSLPAPLRTHPHIIKRQQYYTGDA